MSDLIERARAIADDAMGMEPEDRHTVSELIAKVDALERSDIEAGAWITEWMVADKYRKPGIPRLVLDARRHYQETLAENKTLQARVDALEAIIRVYADPTGGSQEDQDTIMSCHDWWKEEQAALKESGDD